jgi:HTH-type transcriptional regulator/antitoxin HigA
MEITEKEYEVALKRIDELLPLVTDDTPNSDPNLIELLKVSGIVEEYENEHYPISDNSTNITHSLLL